MSSIEKAIDRLSKERSRPGDSNVVSQVTESPNIQADVTQVKRPDTPDGIIKTLQEATLDLDALSKAGYLTPNSKNKILFEEYRIIKRPILMNALGKGAVPIEGGNTVAITSSLPGEGKSYTTFNLGVSIASELDSTVLLIDGDVLHGSLSKMFGLRNSKGLTDVLKDPSLQIGDVIVNTPIPKLKVVPAGTRFEHSTELLASDAMDALVKELAKRYDDRIILFDTPPILATTEASELNRLMGQILVVVEAGQTSVNAVKDSLTHVDDDKVVGLVLNKGRSYMRNSGYGSYYGSYY